MTSSIAIVGCGVTGLSCGIRLLESGREVVIYCREESPHTTSDVAAAFWYPFKAEPRTRLLPWAERAYVEFELLARDPNSGVMPIPITHRYAHGGHGAWWARAVKDFSPLTPDELGPKFIEGFRYQTFLAESPIYMPYLRARYDSLGGKVVRRTLRALSELNAAHAIIVNCSGVWAHELAADREVQPLRGQILRLERPREFEPGVSDFEGFFVACRRSDCIVGGANTEGDWGTEIRANDREYLMKRLREEFPELTKARVIEERVGLRPWRPSVRLELEKTSDGQVVIHNYGHGGAGYTLSWGCAEEVCGLIQQL